MPPPYSDLELQVLVEMGMRPDDPAADAVLSRMAELKEQELAGDPAFQPGSRFFEGRHGAGVESALGLFGEQGGDEGLIELLMALMEQQAGDGYGRVPVAQQLSAEEAAATAAYQRALQMMGLEQAFEREMLGGEFGRERGYALETLGSRQEHERGMGLRGRKLESRLAGMGQKGEREQRGREMKQAGQASMIDIFGRDPAQSVLFELGAMGGGYGEMPSI